MKIKSYFRLLLLIIIILPVFLVFFVPFYFYMKSPERILLKGYRDSIPYSEITLTTEDLKFLRNEIRHMPPDVDLCILSRSGNVLMSSIKEIPVNSTLDQKKLNTLLFSFDETYFYQLRSVKLPSKFYEVTIINRVVQKQSNVRNRKSVKFLLYVSLFVCFFEFFCISLIILLSSTISKSISVLERNTQKIADGELDTKLEKPKNIRFSNEITSLTENLDRMRMALKDNQEKRSRFIMGISHDLRTPVAIIKGYTEAISDGVVTNTESMKSSLAIITEKTNQLETMIDSLISFEKLDLREWRNSLILQSLNKIVSDFAESAVVSGSVFKRNISSSINIDNDIMVKVDKQLFQRALENLYSNALRYTKDGDSIEIKAFQDSENVYIHIKDSGIGINDNDKEHIFDLFYRGTKSRREEGMGIGLAVVKNVIENHGWTIDFVSEEGKGTDFNITIPYKKSLEKEDLL